MRRPVGFLCNPEPGFGTLVKEILPHSNPARAPGIREVPMRRTSWLSSLLIVTLISVAVAADKPDKEKTPKTSSAKPAAKANPKAPKGASAKAAPGAQPTARPANDPRATSLFRSAQNLEKTGKNAGAI